MGSRNGSAGPARLGATCVVAFAKATKSAAKNAKRKAKRQAEKDRIIKENWEDDDDDWDEAQDEDLTIRQQLDSTTLEDAEMEPWAINVRRSVERTRIPAKGILKSEFLLFLMSFSHFAYSSNRQLWVRPNSVRRAICSWSQSIKFLRLLSFPGAGAWTTGSYPFPRPRSHRWFTSASS